MITRRKFIRNVAGLTVPATILGPHILSSRELAQNRPSAPSRLNVTGDIGGSFPAVKAFPTAEGFGASENIGARNASATVLHVDTLANSGNTDSTHGSLRWALTQSGPRYIVFDVNGTINLTTDSPITLNDPAQSYFYLAGQTSPGGVQIKGINTGLLFRDGVHDGIIRHMRVRLGGPAVIDDTGNNISTTAVDKLIFDHCSLQWGTDSQITIYTGSDLITVQWCLNARTLPPGASTGSGAHIGGNTDTDRISLHHNVFAHCHIRNPLVQRGGVTDIVNNVFYNWNGNGNCELGSVQLNASARVNLVKNHWIAGPNSNDPTDVGLWWLENGGPNHPGGSCGTGASENGGTKVYSDNNNWGPLCSSGCANDWSNSVKDGDSNRCNSVFPPNNASESQYRQGTRFTAPAITEHTTSGLRDFLLATVGAYKPSRDSRDTTDCDQVANGIGACETSDTGQTWPTLSGGSPPIDSDGDGVPDSYCNAHGLNPNGNIALTFAPNGYQWIENYLNELAGDTIQYTPIGGTSGRSQATGRGSAS